MARLTGKEGAVYVKISGTFTKIADIYDWEFHANTTMLDASVKGDFLERFIPSHGSGIRFTAKRRDQGLSVFPAFVADSANNATQTEWRLDLIDNNNLFRQITVKGYAAGSSSNAPRDAADETFELQIDESWAYNV